MKIGILSTDILDEVLWREFGTYPEMFQRLLLQVSPALEFETYSVITGEYPATLDACDGYLITGSKCGTYDQTPWIAQLRRFIQQLFAANKPLVGICFGHQLIADELGGSSGKSDRGWGVGVHQVRVEAQPQWMIPAKAHFSLLVSHQDQVAQLPPHAVKIAGSEFCPHAAFQLAESVLCFQGHPEFIKAYSRTLMERRRDRIPADVIARGLASLENDTDHLVVAEWIVRFLTQTDP